MKVNRFEDLDCWKEARVLVRKVYEATRDGEVSVTLQRESAKGAT